MYTNLLRISFFLLASCFTANATEPKNFETFLCDGAGVIPVCDMSNDTWVLLGQESKGHAKGTWDAFTGRRDPHETNPQQTAAREFAEESEFLLMDTPTAEQYIALPAGNTLHVVVNEFRKEVIYFTKFSFEVINKFVKAFVHKPRTGAEEKDLVGMISWQDFVRVFATTPTEQMVKENSPVSTAVSGLVFVRDDQDPRGYHAEQQQIKIRPSRIKTLQSFAKDMLNNALSCVLGTDPRIRFYAA